jgi:hypothetical protein
MSGASRTHWGRLVGAVALTAATLAVAAGPAGAQPAFGVSSFNVETSTPQAGAHADVTTAFMLNENPDKSAVGQMKDAEVELPAGITGNPRAIPKCSQYEFSTFSCLPAAQVGVIAPTFVVSEGEGKTQTKVPIPLFNTTPSPGKVATFVASILLVKITVQVELRQDGTYGLTARIDDLSTLVPVIGASLTLWGVPADPSHEAQRFNELGTKTSLPAGVAPAPFMRNSTDCASGPQNAVLRVDSWQNPGSFVTQTAAVAPPTGCELLRAAPTIAVTPETTRHDSPAGYAIDLAVPQDEEPEELATPALRAISLTLPPGVSLSPAVANGLEGCSDAQFAAESCPGASKIGAVRISSPILPDALTGGIYLGTPTSAEPYRVFVAASGNEVTVKLRGEIQANSATGQLTATFDQNPQQPLSEIQLDFFGGPLAVLANPLQCGPASSTAQLTFYSGQVLERSSSFVVDGDGQGGACPSQLPFAPHFSGGSTTALAGATSAFSLTVSREDGEQELSRISAELPEGLEGMLSSVPLCSDALAAEGACPSQSAIGSTTVAAGDGTEPLYLSGSVYLTGPYRGSPFGLAIVIPVIAGPFNLGTVVIRAQIVVSPSDAHLTVISDPFPQILNGILLRLRTVNLTIDRPGFIVNPTGCSPRAVVGRLAAVEGAVSDASTPFQVGGCGALPFAPQMNASTEAKASKNGAGAGLDIKVTFPAGPHANISSVIVELPDQLQSRLTTIQQACRGATFAENPAACPASSVVGRGTVGTALLATPLSGPVYLVSHGESVLPDLVMTLQGQGVAIDLDGALHISKQGVTSSAFRAVPDVPLQSFELNLPRGPHSALGAIIALCAKTVSLPYEINGQNGAQVRHTSKVYVGGCHRARKHA